MGGAGVVAAALLIGRSVEVDDASDDAEGQEHVPWAAPLEATRQPEAAKAPLIADALASRLADSDGSNGSERTSVRVMGRHANAIPSEAGETAITERWDTMSVDARSDHDRALLDSALVSLEASGKQGRRPSAAVVRRAETSLSALRVSLYATAHGRAEYSVYERRLEAAAPVGSAGKEAE